MKEDPSEAKQRAADAVLKAAIDYYLGFYGTENIKGAVRAYLKTLEDPKS